MMSSVAKSVVLVATVASACTAALVSVVAVQVTGPQEAAGDTTTSSVIVPTTTSTVVAVETTPGGTGVYDGAGIRLGRLVGMTDGSVYDTFTVARDDFYFSVGADGGAYGEVMFDKPGCTGTPFVNSGFQIEWPRPLAGTERILIPAAGSRKVLWFAPAGSALTVLTPVSMLADRAVADSEDDGTDWPSLIDGVGNCVQLGSEYDPVLGRRLKSVPAPFAYDSSGPLELREDG